MVLLIEFFLKQRKVVNYNWKMAYTNVRLFSNLCD